MGSTNEKSFKLNNRGKFDLTQSIRSTNIDNDKKTNFNSIIATTNINNDKQTNLKQSVTTTNFKNDKIVNLKQSIKSKYILIQIFSVLKKNKLLRILEYNKEYQSLLEINLETFKNISGKIKIMGFNGYGKEYKSDTMELTFEGEYLNGQKNGKGKKYYYNGKLEFEGEYLKGKKSGKGKEYYPNGKLKFEGEYLNGQKRKGIEYDEGQETNVIIKKYNCKNKKEYDEKGKLTFVGNYLNGNIIGKEFVNNDKLKIENFLKEENAELYLNENKWNRKVKEYYPNGKLKFERELFK